MTALAEHSPSVLPQVSFYDYAPMQEEQEQYGRERPQLLRAGTDKRQEEIAGRRLANTTIYTTRPFVCGGSSPQRSGCPFLLRLFFH